MDTSPKYDFPWDLISESLSGSISAEGEYQLQQWIASDAANNEIFLKIQELWKNGTEDYKIYKMANENDAWNALKTNIEKSSSDSKETKIIQGRFTQNPKFLRNLIAVAAIFIGIVGIGLWLILSNNKQVIYETAANEQRTVILDDGSSITLNPLTRIVVAANYNKVNRTILMTSGIAYFEVEHLTNKPFVVKLGTTQIKDIGTSFTIRKEEKEIRLKVISGKVQFVKLKTNETRELSAGSGIVFDVKNESFGEIKLDESLSKVFDKPLNFENTPLSEVIITFQKVYGKKLIVNDSKIAEKKITAQLGGMSYNSAIEVICKSLGLEYSLNDSVYILKQKIQKQP